MNTCTRALTGFALAATTAVALAVPASAAPSASAPTAAPSAAAAAPASAAALDPGPLVDTWYGAFLGRDPDAGSRYWVDQLDAGAEPADVLWAITHTNEYHSTRIGYLYDIYLGRAPDAGARYWIEGTNAQRFPLEWVEQNIAASPEGVAAAKRNGGLVQNWYGAVFADSEAQRQPSRREVAYWEGRVRAVGALTAFRELYYAPEVVRTRLDERWFFRLLDRQPTAAEVAYWYPKEVESDINVGVLIASTPEFIALRTLGEG